MNTVECRPAWVWDCELCGAENFERALVLEMSKEEEAELKRKFGCSIDEMGDFVERPKEVMCRSCGQSFEIISR